MSTLWSRQRFGCCSPPLEEETVMRRFLVKALFAFVILAMLAPPGFAQAPAPKVTITGLFDQVTAAGRNFYDGNLTRNSDKEWYARTRFRPDFEFAVGRVKAVLGLEIDLRSEEHTSELQSRLHLVCRLLLEKKKQYLLTSAQRHQVADP